MQQEPNEPKTVKKSASELVVMARLQRQIEALPEPARGRVVRWLYDRYTSPASETVRLCRRGAGKSGLPRATCRAKRPSSARISGCRACRQSPLAHGRLRGYAPLVGAERVCRLNTGRCCLMRDGGAAAVTVPFEIPGFRGWRYRWWDRGVEVAFPEWRTVVVNGGGKP